jgi:ribosomal protein S18 acetylase RimI-like enzyme
MKIQKFKKKNFNSVLDLLNKNLTKFTPKISVYNKICKSFLLQKNLYAVVAIQKDIVIGYGSIFFEKKIRGGTIGYIEDVAVENDFRRHGIGEKIISKLTKFGKKINCYKIVLQCRKKSNIRFYKKCGYSTGGFIMQKIFTKN